MMIKYSYSTSRDRRPNDRQGRRWKHEAVRLDAFEVRQYLSALCGTRIAGASLIVVAEIARHLSHILNIAQTIRAMIR